MHDDIGAYRNFESASKAKSDNDSLSFTFKFTKSRIKPAQAKGDFWYLTSHRIPFPHSQYLLHYVLLRLEKVNIHFSAKKNCN